MHDPLPDIVSVARALIPRPPAVEGERLAFTFCGRRFLVDAVKQRYFDPEREVFGDALTLVATVAGKDAAEWWHHYAQGAATFVSEFIEQEVYGDAPELPQDLELERALLGWLLLKPEMVDFAEEEVGPQEFLSGVHGRLFAAFIVARDQNFQPGVAGIIAVLSDDANTQALDGEVFKGFTAPRYLAYLMASAPPLAPETFADNVRAVARQVRMATEVELGVAESEPEPPEPYKFKFGPMRWSEQYAPGPRYDWLIKGIAPLGENMLIVGPSRSGKTFETMDMSMHIAQGKDFAGRRTKCLGVVYCFYEAKRGARKRMNAYQKFHDLPLEGLPFVALTRAPNLYATSENADALAAEIKELTKDWDVPVGVIVIDTHNAATRGSSEIRSDDIAKILDNYAKVADATGAAIWIVGHTNDEGKHRGNQQFFNTIETAIQIERIEDKGVGERKDINGLVIRRATVTKQREEVDRISWDFVLPRIVIGIDEDGDEITSCVSTEPARAAADTVREQPSKARTQAPAGSFHLNAGEVLFMRALLNALSKSGIAPPPQLKLPASISRVARWQDFSIEFRALEPNDEANTEPGRERYRNKMKARVRRARTALQNFKVIGVDSVGAGDGGEGYHVLWPTGRPVDGQGFIWPTPVGVRAPEPPQIDEATGKPITSLAGDDDEPF